MQIVARQWSLYDMNLRMSDYLRIARQNGAWKEEHLGGYLSESEELIKRRQDECDDTDDPCILKYTVVQAYDRWHKTQKPTGSE